MAWNTDPTHSSFEFAVRHMVVATVHGRFDDFTVTADIDENDLTQSRGTVAVRTASVNTREEQRNAHLRSPDFFAAEQYPEMTYVIRKVEGAGSDYRITGDLTIKDITREVVLDAEITGPVADPWGGTRLGLSATGKLNRKDFGLTWNALLEAGGVTVGDKVEITLEIEAIAKAASAAA